MVGGVINRTSSLRRAPVFSIKKVSHGDCRKGGKFFNDNVSETSSPSSVDRSVDSGISFKVSDRIGGEFKSPNLRSQVLDYTHRRDAPSPYHPHALLPTEKNIQHSSSMDNTTSSSAAAKEVSNSKAPSLTEQSNYSLPLENNGEGSETSRIVNDPMFSINSALRKNDIPPLKPVAHVNSEDLSSIGVENLLDLDSLNNKKRKGHYSDSDYPPSKAGKWTYVDLDKPIHNFVGSYVDKSGTYQMLMIDDQSSVHIPKVDQNNVGEGDVTDSYANLLNNATNSTSSQSNSANDYPNLEQWSVTVLADSLIQPSVSDPSQNQITLMDSADNPTPTSDPMDMLFNSLSQSSLFQNVSTAANDNGGANLPVGSVIHSSLNEMYDIPSTHSGSMPVTTVQSQIAPVPSHALPIFRKFYNIC